MLQDLFINFGAELLQIKNDNPTGEIAKIFNLIFADGNLDDHYVDSILAEPKVADLLHSQPELPQDDNVFRTFIKNYPYHTYLTHQQDSNFLRIFLTQKAAEFTNSLPQSETQPTIEAPQPTFTSQPIAESQPVTESQSTITDYGTEATPETELDLNIDDSNKTVTKTDRKVRGKLTLKDTEPNDEAEDYFANSLLDTAMTAPGFPEAATQNQRPTSIMANKKRQAKRQSQASNLNRSQRQEQSMNTRTNVSQKSSINQTQQSQPDSTSGIQKLVYAGIAGGAGTIVSAPLVFSLFF